MKTMFGKRVPNCVKREHVDYCVKCGDLVFSEEMDLHEDLKKWFKQKWVNIGKKKKGGGHPPCGTSGKKRGYAKCVPASKAASMTKKEKESATRRKRAAQNKKGRGGTSYQEKKDNQQVQRNILIYIQMRTQRELLKV